MRNSFQALALVILAANAPTPSAKIALVQIPPWSYKNAAGTYEGIMLDYLRDVAQDARLPLTEVEIPIGRMLHSMNSRQARPILRQGA